METPQTRVRSEAQRAEAASADKAGEYGRSAEFDCARAMAQAESVKSRSCGRARTNRVGRFKALSGKRSKA
jgi:hypothetical protein